MTASPRTRSVLERPEKVLVAVDAYAPSQHAAAYAKTFVAPRGQVRLVSVAQNPRTLLPMGSFVAGELDAARAELSRDANEQIEALQRTTAKPVAYHFVVRPSPAAATK